MKILGIDTSGHTASVSICDDHRILASASVVTRLTHSQIILPMCKELMAQAELTFKDIGLIAVANGPGSYTGLRIGVAAVKGICFAENIPCVGISTLEGMAHNFIGTECIVRSVMHARQNLVYTADFRINGNCVERLSEDRIVDADELASIVYKNEKAYVTGDHAETYVDKYGNDFTIAPPLAILQSAAGLCFAAINKEPSTADMLNADYMQITKAEKDLIEKNK